MSDREEKLRQADFNRQDQVLNRSEFIDLCVNVMWDTPLDQLKGAAENYSAFKVAKLRRVNVRWQRVADHLDRECRLWIPLLYVAGLCFFAAARFTDDYPTRQRRHGLQMGQGFMGAFLHWNSWGVGLVWICGITAVISFAMYTYASVTWVRQRHGPTISGRKSPQTNLMPHSRTSMEDESAANVAVRPWSCSPRVSEQMKRGLRKASSMPGNLRFSRVAPRPGRPIRG